MALPADESVVGETSDSKNYNPEDPQQIFKLKKFKKLFLGWTWNKRIWSTIMIKIQDPLTLQQVMFKTRILCKFLLLFVDDKLTIK